ncbi:MAG: histidinol dehydrogenase, partial [Casimicrobiaceae bacterium]
MPDIRRLDTADPGFAAALAKLSARDAAQDDAIDASVASIIADVRARGDAAVLEYTALFDRVKAPTLATLELPSAELEAAHDTLPADQRRALALAAERIRAYHARQVAESWSFTEPDGTRLGLRVTPLERVGVYVPGGKAAYPSSVLMNVLPAKV